MAAKISGTMAVVAHGIPHFDVTIPAMATVVAAANKIAPIIMAKRAGGMCVLSSMLVGKYVPFLK